MQVLSMSELVKSAVAEAEAHDKQVHVGSAEVPATVQLGRAAQSSMQVRAVGLPCQHNSPCVCFTLCPSCFHKHLRLQLHNTPFHANRTPRLLSRRLNSYV